MEKSFQKLTEGYRTFRNKYAYGDTSVMRHLSVHGQQPEIMVISCSDSRVDPALILQCQPGDLFVVRNVANIVPPYEKDEGHHGTSAALEFGIRFLKVKHLILLGHSQCGGIQSLLYQDSQPNDFITPWMSLIKKTSECQSVNKCAQSALKQSYQHCLTFPWLKKRLEEGQLLLHLWFFDIEEGKIFTYSKDQDTYLPLNEEI